MIISIASGKGGTGKTLFSTSLALSIGACRFLDCDVEEPNAGIFLKPEAGSRESVSVLVPSVDAEKCGLCGKCAKVCEFNAIAVTPDKVLIFPELCHSCGACAVLCPKGAIAEKEKEIGVIESGRAGAIDCHSGRLNVGVATAVPLIRALKKKIGVKDGLPTIIDCPPGTSCPVIEAVKGSDYSILVTEPTPFGLSDLKLAAGVLRKLKIPFGVVVNRSGSGFPGTAEYLKGEGIEVLMEIEESRQIAEAYSRGVPLVRAMPEYAGKLRGLFGRISG